MRRGAAICSFLPRTARCVSTRLLHGKISRCSVGCYYGGAVTSAAARSRCDSFGGTVLRAVFGITASVHAGRSGAVLFVVTGGFLLPLAMIDWQHQLLPDCLTQPLLWAGLVLHAIDHTLPLRDALFGAVAGYLSLWLLYWAFRLIAGREGLGYRDFKLLAALGAWCGWQALPSIELAAALSGIVGYFAVNNLNKNNLTISFGTYLAFSGIVVFISQQFAFTF